MWKDRLSALAKDRLPAEAAETWIELFQPGIRLADSGPGPRVARLGGNPALPPEVDWPSWPDRGPLNFIAAVDCAALPREFLSIPLPAEGTLLFFYFDGERHPGYPDPAFVEDVEGSRVIFVPAGTAVTERTPPADINPYPSVDLFAEIVATAPEREHLLLDQTRTASGATLAEAVQTVLGPGRSGPDVFGELRWEIEQGPFHQIGGFATPIQGPVEKEVAGEVYEGSWYDPGFAEEAARWVLLAQIDSSKEADMCWGDVGMLYWVIRSADLAAGRFENARCTMQCG
ncbi:MULTISPECIES: YwqG family protein [unclassified Crossiella]|uniref:YwqG family protein n=1 Tax=unclassified Crossiella TaxID=2620835 RepID=UPI001FFF75BB|nr:MULTISPECIES: YwqG family protein [unclassified Crossiella]MCK2244104.1 YwqG family protein [Crossiella sp. S99.2]MCK2257908.1 YwqG family protein [Crossiella sp. S99.1]